MMRKLMDRLKRSKAFNLLLVLMLTVSTLPVQAFAAEPAPAQARMSGTCYLQCIDARAGTFNITMPDGQVIPGHCANPGWPTPVDGNYAFTATDIGGGVYSVTVNCSYVTSNINQIHPQDHGHMIGNPPWRTQSVAGTWVVARYGKISLHKQSANPGCTDSNALYSLAGAEYGIYSDPGCTQWVATMVTDAAGNAVSGDLQTGTYYVKEGKASEGFQVDPTVYTVNVPANATVAVNNGVVYETPINDPAGILVGKYDGDKSYNSNNLPQGSASLEGAEFTVRYYDGFYDTEQQAEASGAPTRTWVFRTNKNGYVDFQNPAQLVSGDPLYQLNGFTILPRGTIVVRETKAPEGYNLNADFVSVQKIKAPGDSSNESTYNTPQIPEEVKRGGVSVQKLDAQTGSKPQGTANFEGITFSIINDGDNAVTVDGVSYDKGQVVKTITTDAKGLASTSGDCLPFGKYIIRETASNGDYLITAPDIHATVAEDGKVYSFTAKDEIVRGGVKVSKRDLESGLPTSLGAANLDGTRFEVKSLNDSPVLCGGVTYRKGDVITTLTIKDGEASTAADLLPFGKYSIQEVAVGDGYRLTDGTVYKFDITKNGQIVNGVDGVVKNQVKRGDLEFVKVSEADMSRLAGVPFRITSETTGESHILVTDENGYASTSAEWNKHTHKTNANDTAAEEDYDSEAGIWFGLAKDGSTVPANDKLGALPYDTYTVEELRCAANEGFVLVRIEGVTIKRNSVTVDLGTIDDSLQTEAYIHTSARDGMDGDKLILPDERALVTDHVEFTGLVPGKAYTMRATLVDQKTGDVIGGPVEKGFTPAGQSGSVEMEITVDLLDYAGRKVVVFEELLADGGTVCEHKDLDDTEQTLRVLTPSIGTTAKDGIDGDQQAVIDPEAVIIDTVSYKNLVPGREYTVKGQLMVKSTGEALKVDGKAVTAEAKFTPSDTTGTVDVTFNFDGSALKGESVVVFETLYRGDKELAVHADIDDEGQTIEFTKPSIGTTAKDGIDGDHHSATDPEAVIVDTISYKGLVPGKEYTAKGKLMLKSSGEPLLDEDGKPVTVEAKFTPDGTYGTVDVTFTFDATDLDGESVVVFETLYRGDIKITSHADIDDEGQTIEFTKPSIGTTAKDGVDGDHHAVIDPEAVIVDTVAYTGLIPGKEYTVKGKLMLKDSGEDLKVGGKAVTAEAVFTPDHPSGTVDVTFTFDASALAGKQVVAFETLYRLGKKICTHADIDDMGQTVEFMEPEIGTTAKDGIDGDKFVVADGTATLVDTIAYTGLIPGKEYTVKGKLMLKDSGEPLKGEDGKAVTAEAVFTPDHDHGTVDVTFTFDCLQLAGQQVVAFETLYRLDKEICTHADIDDMGQTVTIIQPTVKTAAIDGIDGDKKAVIDPETVISDKILFDRVIPGASYEVHGIVMDGETGLPLLSGEGEGDAPTADELADFWQQLLDLTGIAVAAPLDTVEGPIADEPQDKGFLGWLGSLFGADGKSQALDSEPTAEQVLDGVWFPPVKLDWDAIEALLEDNPEIASRLIRNSVDFSPEKDYGEANLDFTFDATEMAGKDAVVFELLVKDGCAVAAHADITDKDQTVPLFEPEIGTTAKDGVDGDQSLVADGTATIVDTIAYKDLIPGKEYKVVGTLMLKDSGEPLLNADGEPVTAEAVFTPDHDHGTVDVTFTFDASLLAGQQVVAFETLYRLDKEITAHADIEDKDQTVDVIQPVVDTVAVDGFDGDKDVVADPEARITDTLSYKNVIPGSTYEVHGILMDAETGLPLLSGEGADKVSEDDLTDFWNELCGLTGITSAKPLDDDLGLFASIGGLFGSADEGEADAEVWFPQAEPDWAAIEALLEDTPEIADHLSTATETFEADKDHGEIEMDFGLDASGLAGKKAVVFELLVKDGIAVGAHSDLTDADQTVTIVPSTIGTEATDKTDGDHEVMVSKEVTIVDAVHYENLLPGKEYTLEGVLMDKSTGKPLMVNDKKVEASASFTPNKPNGTVELEFTFDATALEGKEVVAFETLYKDGIEVAAHTDIDDAAQTVKFVKPPKGTVYDKTGNMLSGYGWVAALLVVAAVAGAGYAGKQYLDARKEKDEDADGGES